MAGKKRNRESSNRKVGKLSSFPYTLSAMKRARYFPPSKPRMCREYCPWCKRKCELQDEHKQWDGKDMQHICAGEHRW